MRNKVSHEYFGIDYEIIWDVASNHLPENKRQLEGIIEREKSTRHIKNGTDHPTIPSE